jgi:hypothetical protein
MDFTDDMHGPSTWLEGPPTSFSMGSPLGRGCTVKNEERVSIQFVDL